MTWPYPFWIAHRGAGTLAPENTLAAFRQGFAHGFCMFECDVKLSADGVPFLLHDDTLDRTTNGQGAADALPWAALSQLDAGSWHSPAFAGESIPTLAQVARFCHHHSCQLNIEIKPMPGTEARTGEAVAQAAAHLWSSGTPPLLSSFAVSALQAARAAQPHLPRALLLDQWVPGWLDTARALDCCAVVAHHSLWAPAHAQAVHAAGMKCLSYTVNGEAQRDVLQSMAIDGLMTDRMDWVVGT